MPYVSMPYVSTPYVKIERTAYENQANSIFLHSQEGN